MKKNTVLLLTFLALFIFIFSIPVSSIGNGCCWSETECTTDISESDCNEVFPGSTFEQDDQLCTIPYACKRGCCCRDALNIPTTNAFCNEQGGTFYVRNDWSTVEYLETNGINGLADINLDICMQLCLGGYPNCEFISCEENTFTEYEKCYCSDGSLADTSSPYCCYQTGEVYDGESACTVACGADTTLTGTILGRLDLEDEQTITLQGAEITISGKKVYSDSEGKYTIQNVQSSGSIGVTKSGYLPKEVSYTVIDDGYEINITLAQATLSCVGGSTRACTVTKQGCATERVCENGAFSECRIIESSCQVAADCDNDIWEAGEACVVSTNEGCEDNEVCINCQYCKGPVECLNFFLEPEGNEECDPDRTENPTTFLNTVKQQCNSDYAINCTLDCKCVYQEPTCGDRVVTYGEQCDWKDNLTTTISSLCDADNCGKPGELTACKCDFINRNSCGDGYISGAETCEVGVNTCPNGEECVDCQCNSTCSDAPSLSLDSYVNGIVSLSWLLPRQDCGNNIEMFDVFRCNATDDNECAGEAYVVDSIPKDDLRYSSIDSLAGDDANYCYWVRASYNLTQGIISAESNIVCLNTGFKFCEGDTTTEFCEDNVRKRCNNTQIYTLPDDQEWNCSIREDYICVKDNEIATRCAYRVDCDRCNGVFDMFYLEGTTYDQEGNEILCSETEGCYLDSTPTTVDKYYSCFDVNSCYDYFSEEACTQDKCAVKNCEWEYSETYGDLGLGVCRPTEPSLQVCKLCEDPTNVVFGECTREFCELYGDCYYDEQPNYNNLILRSFGCIPYTSMSCDYYDFYEECGSDSVVDTVWNLETTYKEGYSNEIIEPSLDYLNLGTCKWILHDEVYTCAKDADNNTIKNKKITGGVSYSQFDCPNDDLECQSDNQPPNTTIIYRSVVPKSLDLEYTVYDNVYGKDKINTYFCIKPHNALPCYPGRLANGGIIIDEITESGIYDLYYFSEDFSHNLEVVKKVEILVEIYSPQVDFNYDMNSEEIDPINFENEWRTNITFSFNITNKNATCEAYLINNEGEVNYDSGLHGAYGDKFKVQYNYLKDDKYTFILRCEDNVGNTNSPTYYEILVDADMSIYDPKPDYTINSGDDVAISVKTNRSATCKYDLDETDYDEMQYTFDSGDKLYHTSVIDVPGRFIKVINVKCKFDDSGKVYGNNADNIKFAIDDIGPNTAIVDSFNISMPDYLSTWRESAHFYLLCEDEPIYENDNPYSKDWAFGCNSTYYGKDTTPVKKYVVKYNVNLTESGIYNLAYYSVDNGLNKGDTIYKTAKIDNLSYAFYVYITDFITGHPVDSVTVNRRYKVDIFSFKTTLVDYDPDYNILVNSLTFSVNGDVVIVDPSIEYITNTQNWEGYFILDKGDFENIKGYTARFKIHGIDSHTIESDIIIFGGNFTIDTSLPDKPLFDPILEEYPLYEYPLYKYNNIYYTNDQYLYVSASYSEQETNVLFYLQRDTQTGPVYRYFNYDQANNGKALFSKNLYENAAKGTTEIYLQGDAGHQFKQGNYVEFSGHKREYYRHYKEFYEITSVDSPVVVDGRAIKTRIEIYPGLEQNISQGVEVIVYNGSHPQGWAGTWLYMQSEYQGERKLFVEVEDAAGNINADAAIIYLDTSTPVIITSSLYPKDGFSISGNNTPISAVIRERGAGLDTEIINFTIKGIFTNSTYTDFINDTYTCDYHTSKVENGDYICYNISFVPDHDLLNDLYQANLIVYDLAHNFDQEIWYFYVEAGAPDMPEFRLKDAPEPNPDPDNIWYIQETPDFILNFSDPEPITLISMNLTNEDGVNVGNNPPICTQTENFFDCSFDDDLSEQEYSLGVVAYKTLDDGNISPPGRWAFFFTVDNTPPEFEIDDYKNPAKPDINIDFKFYVSNEQGVSSRKPHNLLGYFRLNDNEDMTGMNYSVEESNRIFRIPASFEWPMQNPVEDFNVTIKIRDYAGNYNEETYPIRIDGEVPLISLTNITATKLYLKRLNPDFSSYLVTKPEVEIILAAQYALIEGIITRGYKGHDTNIFKIVVYDDEIESNRTVDFSKATSQSNLAELSSAMGGQGKFYDGTFKASLLIPGRDEEETLNNLRFFVEDMAENLLDIYLGMLKDLKKPDEPVITIS